MPELIDKQASMKAICDGCFKSRAVDLELRCRGTCDAIDTLQQQPTIDAEPVRHGRWILKILPIGGGDKIMSYLCSECDRYTNMKFDFCPNCGARMDTTDTNDCGKGGND